MEWIVPGSDLLFPSFYVVYWTTVLPGLYSPRYSFKQGHGKHSVRALSSSVHANISGYAWAAFFAYTVLYYFIIYAIAYSFILYHSFTRFNKSPIILYNRSIIMLFWIYPPTIWGYIFLLIFIALLSSPCELLMIFGAISLVSVTIVPSLLQIIWHKDGLSLLKNLQSVLCPTKYNRPFQPVAFYFPQHGFNTHTYTLQC